MRLLQISILLFGFIITDSINTNAQVLKQTIASKEWNYDSLGNHRVVVAVPNTGKVAKVEIEWRRRDEHPELKNIFIVDSATGEKIENFKIDQINREKGTIYFDPVSGKGVYYIYYMPIYQEGSPYYPKAKYYSVANNSPWQFSTKNIVVATPLRIESVNKFNSFDPMEIIATQSETELLLQKIKIKTI